MALCIGASGDLNARCVKKKTVNHRLYGTSSMLYTIFFGDSYARYMYVTTIGNKEETGNHQLYGTSNMLCTIFFILLRLKSYILSL